MSKLEGSIIKIYTLNQLIPELIILDVFTNVDSLVRLM